MHPASGSSHGTSAHSPKPCSSQWRTTRSRKSALSSRRSGRFGAIQHITAGSAFIATTASRSSAGRHGRSSRRSVSMLGWIKTGAERKATRAEPPEVPSSGSLREGRPGISVAGLATSGPRSLRLGSASGTNLAAPSRRSQERFAKNPQSAKDRVWRGRVRNVPGMSAIDLQDVAWDLDPLVDGDGPDGADRLLAEADERAARFAEAYAGRVGELDGAGLSAAMAELEAIVDRLGRAGSYAMLRFAVDTADPANGALLARVQERATAVETKLLFFELEWAAIDDDRVEELLSADGLQTTRHHLRTLRRYRPHLLSEPEEKLLTEKALTGRDAWTRLFSELTSAIRVELPDAEEGVPLDVALSRLVSPDREVRRTTAEAVSAALEPGLRTRASVFNTLLLDKAVDDRLRSFPTWLASRNLANEASDESVQALLEAVRSNYDLPRRWYRLKAELLGVDRLADYDRMASVADE